MHHIIKAAGESITGNIEKAILKIPRCSFRNNQKVDDGVYCLTVQYNPNTLKMNTTSNYPNGENENLSEQTISKKVSETTLKVDLIFDDVNNQDAFLWDKFRLSLGGALSTAAAFSSQYNNTYSVRKYVEALVALSYLSGERHVGFVWGNMIFIGELHTIKTTYTMFNPQGEPVRATVSLTIQDRLEAVDATEEKRLKSGEGNTGAQSKTSKAGDKSEYAHWNSALSKFLGSDNKPAEIVNRSPLEELSAVLNL